MVCLVVIGFGDSWVDDSGLIVSWVNDPSSFDFWVDDPAWVGVPEDVEDAFLVVGSGRASIVPLLDLPPLPEELVALGGISVSL